MRFQRAAVFAAAVTSFVCTASANDSAGLQILIDMQDPAMIAKTFCVHESKLFSIDSQICISSSIKMTCSLADAADESKGVKWIVVDEKTRCRQQ